MGSLLCCYYYRGGEEEQFSKTELLHDNIILSYKVIALKQRKLCMHCLKQLEDYYYYYYDQTHPDPHTSYSTSTGRPSRAATSATASCRV